MPDLTTKEGALDFLNYKAPDGMQTKQHGVVNAEFQNLVNNIWDYIPNGPGKTVLVRKIQEARMAANCVIANDGA